MSQIPTELLYSASHQWVAVAPDGSVAVSITDFAQELNVLLGAAAYQTLTAQQSN